MSPRTITVTPSASRLVTSLRDIGYDAPTAVADLVDNSISARARHVEVIIRFDGARSRIIVRDDGHGMTADQLDEALRFGSRRTYNGSDLGRFGLGMKTASLSLGRRVTVASRRAVQRRRISSRVLDLDHVVGTDSWQVLDGRGSRLDALARELLAHGPGTVVIIDRLDRLLPEQRPDSGFARRRLRTVERSIRSHLATVFHRFLERPGDDRLTISVNGDKLRPWNPFAPDEPATRRLPVREFEITTGGRSHRVTFTPFVLPPRAQMSSPKEFERLSGPRKWNRQQGLYIYRADRMIQSGGWSGLRSIDEHTKLARAAIDFGTGLDQEFRINVAKMRVALPAQLRSMLQRPVNELCSTADAVYRRAGRSEPTMQAEPDEDTSTGAVDVRDVSLALTVAAAAAHKLPAFRRIMDRVRELNPTVARRLGW